MRYLSTRQAKPDRDDGGNGRPVTVSLEEAIMSGTAPDGGLYVPETLPSLVPRDFDRAADFPGTAQRLLTPFFADSSLAAELPAICAEALNFPVPLRHLEGEPTGDSLWVLELFHGPTAAFKDVGARFLAATMARIVAAGRHARAPVTILVATSGDTGGAVAAAFHRRPGLRVMVLFPEGRVSPRQQHQLTCWGGNVVSLAVRGGFDDCQRLVKEAFADADLNRRHRLCSANSINVGRLLPQAAYYVRSSLEHWWQTGRPLSYIIPTGNLGNAFACVWARRFGLPIDRIVLATNANTTIPDFLATGQWVPRPSTPTLASAMDVGNPSNMERLRQLTGDLETLRGEVMAVPVSDDGIRTTLRDEQRRSGLAWCPHTATGFHVYRHLPEAERRGRSWAVVATAHAAKFDTIVEPLLGITVPPPPELAALLELPSRFETVDARIDEIRERL